MPSPRAKLTLAVAVPVLAGSLAALVLASSGLPPAGPGPVPAEAGRALAHEALRVAAPGGKVVVLARDPAAYAVPADAAALAALEHGLRAAGREPSEQLFALDPLRPPQVPPGDFFEALRRAGPGDVVVSLLGPPLLTDDQRAALGTPKAKVVAFCPGATADYVNLPLLAEAGLLHGGVFARPSKGGAAAPAAARETFDALYVTGLPREAAKP